MNKKQTGGIAGIVGTIIYLICSLTHGGHIPWIKKPVHIVVKNFTSMGFQCTNGIVKHLPHK